MRSTALLAFVTAALAIPARPDVTPASNVLNPDRLQVRRALETHGSSCLAIAISPSGARVASGDLEGKIFISNPNTGRLLATLEAHPGGVASLAISPDGRWLASGGRDRTVGLWDLASMQRVRSLEGFAVTHLPVRFTPDGKRLIYRAGSSLIGDWDVAAGRSAGEFVGHPRDILCFAFHPARRLMASTDNGGNVKVWDLDSRALVKDLRHGTLTTSVSFSPDGDWLATSDWDGTMRVWDARDLAREPRVKTDSKVRLNWLAFSPDRRHIVTGDELGVLRVYRLPQVALAREIQASASPVEQIEFSRNGAAMVVARQDGTVTVWRTR